MNYKIITDPGHRAIFKSAASNVVRFIRDNRITHVVAIDKKGRGAGLLVREVFKVLHPRLPVPKIYFIDRLFVSESTLPQYTLLSKISHDEPILVLDDYVGSMSTLVGVANNLRRNLPNKIYSAGLISHSNPSATNLRVDLIGARELPPYTESNSLGPRLNIYFDTTNLGVVSTWRGTKARSRVLLNVSQLRRELKELAAEIKKEKAIKKH